MDQEGLIGVFEALRDGEESTFAGPCAWRLARVAGPICVVPARALFGVLAIALVLAYVLWCAAVALEVLSDEATS